MRDRETAWIPFGGAAITATAATLVATNRENYAQIHEGEQAKIGSITNRWELFNE